MNKRKIDVDYSMEGIRINASEWFEREDFKRFLQRPEVPSTIPPWGNPCYGDEVYMTYDHGDGAYVPDGNGGPEIPEDIWDKICEICGDTYCILRIHNADWLGDES